MSAQANSNGCEAMERLNNCKYGFNPFDRMDIETKVYLNKIKAFDCITWVAAECYFVVNHCQMCSLAKASFIYRGLTFGTATVSLFIMIKSWNNKRSILLVQLIMTA